MNDTLDYKISVMQAAKEGKPIERKPRGGDWFLCPDPTWDWAFNDYRVKAPEPRRIRIHPAITLFEEEGEFIELTPEVRKALSL